MDDHSALEFLHEKIGSDAEVAKRLKISPQALSNWKARKISASGRPRVWALLKGFGKKLPPEWAMVHADEARAA